MKNLTIILSACVFFFSLTSSAKTDRPFVFIHGLGVPTEIYQKPFSLEAVFKKRGHELIVIKSPIINTINSAKDYAISDLAKKLPLGTFHLIGHSQGGIVARLLANDENFKNRILSVTTLDSPHHGTLLADEIVKLWNMTDGHLPSWARDVLNKYFGGSIDVLNEMTVASMEGKFNISVLDNTDIRYFSMGHYIPYPEWSYTAIDLLALVSIYLKSLGGFPNDGLLPTSSAHWGEVIGDYPGDHLAESFPIPFGGKLIVYDTFNRVMNTIDKNF